MSQQRFLIAEAIPKIFPLGTATDNLVFNKFVKHVKSGDTL